ncbi:phosphoribosyl transferase domain protein [Leptospira wolbachii serovar Codice str. CDC]|uniref:Phosphoribosyl transferase domain protein n=1 Tax=Leptospira wolbachii serovar Codice str. CDC TaxID=1218599 RepID=R9A8U9_9LEPT|nr:phosphoribosyltransferase family protein [Leptospira wolbachii]EOQ98542.1 phosphoribosyl transferase domain protein [Leptospira wolbachii serovar Codice str. CDC]
MRGVSFLSFVFPKFCVACGSYDHFSETMAVCKPCTKLHYLPQKQILKPNQVKLPFDRFVFYDQVFYLQTRGNFEKSLFQSLKFENERHLAKYFCLGQRSFSKCLKGDPPDRVVLVPSSPKAGPRPYHASYVLLAKWKKLWKIREDTSLRKVSADKQSSQGYESRFFHAKKAFQFTKSDRIMEGLHVLIVDDIFTTGATVNEIARLYKQAGVRKVTCVVLLLSGGD